MKNGTNIDPSVDTQNEQSDPYWKKPATYGLTMQNPFVSSDTPIITDPCSYVEISPNNLTIKSPKLFPDLPFRAPLAPTPLSISLYNDKTLHLAEHIEATGNMQETQNPISDITINSNDYTPTESLLALNTQPPQKTFNPSTSEINKLLSFKNEQSSPSPLSPTNQVVPFNSFAQAIPNGSATPNSAACNESSTSVLCYTTCPTASSTVDWDREGNPRTCNTSIDGNQWLMLKNMGNPVLRHNFRKANKVAECLSKLSVDLHQL
ncbi:uncharacterized protein LOC124900089 [Capsicum annuum]|uniref:uncharacterized protein LOC124900089 n=1 Tax=Capsicum annuum TaxID=4072 RepID=UPI001FB0B965|nr:uncharacterized protein LOC124900089 [Capsicum annuum]